MKYRPSKLWGEYRKEIISMTPEEQCFVLVEDATAETSCRKQVSDASGWRFCPQTSGIHWGDEHYRILHYIIEMTEKKELKQWLMFLFTGGNTQGNEADTSSEQWQRKSN